MANVGVTFERIVYAGRMYGWMLQPSIWWRLKKKAPDRTIDRPIFILGTQGGGLTLLTRMLRRHGHVVSGAGGAEYWTAADEIQNIYGPALPADLAGARWKVPPHPHLPSRRSWTYGTKELLPAYRRTSADLIPEVAEALRRAIATSLHRHARGDPSARFLDKSQTYMLRVGLIAAALRDCDPQFVLMPREPYVSVRRAAIGKARDMADLKDRTPYEERIMLCAEHYGNCVRAVFEDCDAAGLPLHLVRFEDLLVEPELRLRELCESVGLEFRKDMLPAAHHRLPYGSRFRDRWYPVKSDVNAPYESQIDRTTIAAVNFHCGDVLDRLGYRRREEGEALVESAEAV